MLRTFAEALVPGGQALVGTHVGDSDVLRTEGYGGLRVPTTHLYRREQLAGMLVNAGFEVIAELRLPVQPPSLRPQVLLAARGARPDPARATLACRSPHDPGPPAAVVSRPQ